MKTYSKFTTPRLSIIITGTILASLVAILLPGMLWVKSSTENRLINDKLNVLKQVNSDWTSRLDDQFLRAERSINRFGEVLSSTSFDVSQEHSRRFDQLVSLDTDGAWRSDRKYFSGEKEAGIWLQKDHPVTEAAKGFFMQAKVLTEIFGKGALGSFVDTWILPKEGGVIIYWPTEPDWIYCATANLDYTGTPWVTLTHPEANPAGVPKWTPTSFDPAPKVWMISVVAPFKLNNKWAGAVGHDLPISVLMQKIDEVIIYPNTKYMLANRAGTLLISSDFNKNILDSNGSFRIHDTGDHTIANYFNQLSGTHKRQGRSFIYEDKRNARIIIYSHVNTPDWYFITIVPITDLLQSVRSSYGYIWMITGLILVILGLLPSLIISRMVIPAVSRILKGTRQVTAGNLDYSFRPEATEEFNSITDSLNKMIAARKIAEQSLKESEERYRGLVSNIPGVVYRCVYDKAWTVHVISDEIKKISGYPPSDFIDNRVRSFASIIHPDDTAMVQEAVTEGVRRRQPYIIDYRIFDSAGRIHWVYEKGQGVFGPKDELLWLDGVIFDVTERKLAAEALKESEEKYRIMAELTGQMVYDYDIHTGNIKWSGAIEKITGFTTEEFENVTIDTWKNLVHEKDRECLLTLLEDARGKSSPYKVEYRFKHKDGSFVFVEDNGSFLKDEADKPYRMLGNIKDITKRKQAEIALRESEQKHRELLEHIPQKIFYKDKNSVYVTCNDNYARDFNITAEQITGKTDYNFFSKELAEKYRADDKRIIRTGKAETIEEDYVLPDGQKRIIQTVKTPIKNEKGEIIGLLGIFMDITEQKQFEENLKQSQKMEAIGTLAGGIAHDFNNILGGIIGYTELAQDEAVQDTPAQKYLTGILKLSTRAKNLVKQILTFSRKSQEERKPVLVYPIVKEAVTLLRSTIPTTIEIIQNIDEHSGMVTADPTQIHQIVMNLCTNAAHAMQTHGGVLEIHLSNFVLTEQFADSFHDLTPGSYIELKISDTGSGIDSSILPRIFEPFFTTKEKEKGTGMGLAVVHGIIKSYGGDITVETQIGKGSTFTVLLPKTITEPERKEEALVAIPGGNECILFVDDEETLMDIGKGILQSLGYTVVTCNSSIEALKKFELQPDKFDLVITDQTMPHMTGYELAQKVIAIRNTISVIVCTGYSETLTPEQAEATGIKAFVYKPISKKEIARRIREVLDKREV